MSTTKFKIFDVRPILSRGEEPFGAIRTKITALGPEQGLTIIAPFLPAPLIEVLKSEGYASSMEHRADGGWAVSFWRE